MKKILITGGTGFVGRHLLNLLAQKEPQSEIHLTSLTPEPNFAPAHVHQLDLSQASSLTSLIQNLAPTQIYHLASLSSVADSYLQPHAIIDNNFRLTLNLLETLRQHSPRSRLLLISSGEIYAPNAHPISETHPLRPSNPYAASKAIQDMLGQSYASSYKLPVIIARPFNHIGPHQREGFVVADFASQIAKIEQGQISEIRVGNLEVARDFTDVRDIVKAYYLLMNKGKIGEIYNLGSGQATKISTIMEKLTLLAKVKIKVTVDKNKFRPVDTPSITAQINKIVSLGWQPQITLDQTLSDILDYWRGIIKK
jgi:GDP-4-dehydro-6-deoxy-D-mannose reductase